MHQIESTPADPTGTKDGREKLSKRTQFALP